MSEKDFAIQIGSLKNLIFNLNSVRLWARVCWNTLYFSSHSAWCKGLVKSAAAAGRSVGECRCREERSVNGHCNSGFVCSASRVTVLSVRASIQSRLSQDMQVSNPHPVRGAARAKNHGFAKLGQYRRPFSHISRERVVHWWMQLDAPACCNYSILIMSHCSALCNHIFGV